MINDITQIGSWAAKIAWHIAIWLLNALVGLIGWIATTAIGWLVAMLQYVYTNTGLSELCQPIVAAQLPYWENVALLVNWMASTFVGNGTLQFCLSVILEVLVFSLVLRAFFWIWAHIPIIGGGV